MFYSILDESEKNILIKRFGLRNELRHIVFKYKEIFDKNPDWNEYTRKYITDEKYKIYLELQEILKDIDKRSSEIGYRMFDKYEFYTDVSDVYNDFRELYSTLFRYKTCLTRAII